MTDYTTLEELKPALRIDHEDDDTMLEILIKASSQLVSEYLKDSAPESDYPAEVPERVRLATIMLVGYFYRNPDADPEKAFDPGYLPAPVQSILYPLRKPTIA